MPLTHPSRRAFLKATVVAGVSVVIAPLGGRAFAALFEEKILTPVQWDPKTSTPKFRIDGIAKVTGDKVFFNGQPLSDSQQDNLTVLCMKPGP